VVNVPHSRRSIGDAEFAVDGAEVVAHGTGAQVQGGGDLGIGQAFGGQPEHFGFAGAEKAASGPIVVW